MADSGLLPEGVYAPNHVVIIPDGDRRWARAQGKTAMEGHLAGIKRMIEIARVARKMGIHTLTAWGLSTENWKERPANEVEFLFRGMAEHLKAHLKEAKKDGARIVHLGRKDRMPEWFVEEIRDAEEQTKSLNKHIVNLGLDYNGRDEILRAIEKAVAEKGFGGEISKEVLEAKLDTAGQPYPYPDLIIRTSGEQRTSGILAWQAEYAEMYFEPENFPDFSVEKFVAAITDFSRRRRRFGGNDAMEHFKFRPEVVARFELAWWRMQEVADRDKEVKVGEMVVEHLKEQFGVSKELAGEIGRHLVEAIKDRKAKKWDKVKKNLVKFYELIKQEVGYAFEPEIVAGLEVRWMKVAESDDLVEIEGTAKQLYAEVYRISLLQAAKAAHLRALAAWERRLALAGVGNSAIHWQRAEEYLVRFYQALKEKVA